MQRHFAQFLDVKINDSFEQCNNHRLNLRFRFRFRLDRLELFVLTIIGEFIKQLSMLLSTSTSTVELQPRIARDLQNMYRG